MEVSPCGLDRFGQALDVLIRARYPLIAVTTAEEPRFHRLVTGVASAERHRAKGLFWWSRTLGLHRLDHNGLLDKTIPETEDPFSVLEHIASAERGIYVLADYGPYVSDPIVTRKLREIAWEIKTRPVTVILLGADFPDVPGLAKELTTLDLDLPDEGEVDRILTSQLDQLKGIPDLVLKTDGATLDQLRLALLGLTEAEIENAIAKAAITHRGISAASIPLILDEKRAAIKQIGALTYSHPEPATSLGGYANLRQLLTEAAVTFTPAARAFGVEPSKGMLLVGLPGCGKDLCKKIASGIFGRPLLDLDMAALMGEGGGVIGSAGAAMKRALSIATTLKAVLGISEFEKGVGGMKSSAQSDAGETARTIGALLSWMQEQQDVFVFATANDVRQLAPEQIRQGRFSQVVFVDLPSTADRADIFRVHLAKRGRNPDEFALDRLAELSVGFSGAEIEAVVKRTILEAYMTGGRPLTNSALASQIKGIRPTSEVKREDIEELRKWAREHLAIDVAKAPTSADGERRLEF